jgi:hypothetical protein
MSYRLLTATLITAGAVLVTQSYVPAEAAKNLNTSRSNIYREGTSSGATGPAATTTVKSTKSNTSGRMGGGGGGKGAVQRNSQPKPPARMTPIQPVHLNR